MTLIGNTSYEARGSRLASFLNPVKNPSALLIHVAPDTMEYPFRSHPLGLMYLAAYAEKNVPGVSVSICDMKVSGAGPDRVKRAVAEAQPTVIGLGGLSVHAEWLHRAAAEAREAAPGALIIAGGPHTTCFPARVLQDGNIDAVVSGEGERPFAAIMSAISEGRPIKDLPAVGTDAEIGNGSRDIVENPDDIPFPAWDKIDTKAYMEYSCFSIVGRRRYMSIFTSRACPYACIYCHSIFGRKFRPRSAENVIGEIRAIVKNLDIRDFDILDDAFNLKRDRVIEICETIIREKLNISMTFPNGLRSDLLDKEIITLLRRAGTTYISFAIETAAPRLQKLIGKNLDIGKAAEAIRLASKSGILCNGFFMLGFPTETEEELRSTINFAIHSPLQVAHFLKVTPFEGTGLYDMLDEDAKKMIEEHPEYLCYEDRHVNMTKIPGPRFAKLFKRAMMRFYPNPFRGMALLKRHPNRRSLLLFIPIALKKIFIRG